MLRVDLTSWDTAYVFDHVTVTATTADKSATVCLYPADELERSAVLSSATGSCADAHLAAWTFPPAIERWGLADSVNGRALNFVFTSGAAVHVTAEAGFGGRASVAVASGDATASGSYSPDLTLFLAPQVLPIPASCPLRLEQDLALTFTSPQTGFCEGAAQCPADTDRSRCPLCKNPIDCSVCETPGACAPCNPVECSSHSQAMSCHVDPDRTQIFGRVLNDVPRGCANRHELVFQGWRDHDLAPVVPGGCSTLLDCDARVYVSGRFVRCAQGSPGDRTCVLTTDCTPPSTTVGIARRSDLAIVSSQDLACLPPYPTPFTVSTLLRPPPEDWELVLEQDPVQAAAPGACFFDLYGVYVDAVSEGCPLPTSAGNGAP